MLYVRQTKNQNRNGQQQRSSELWFYQKTRVHLFFKCLVRYGLDQLLLNNQCCSLFVITESLKLCTLNYLKLQNGFVFENSPVGTKVVDAEGNEISFEVTDADHDTKVLK